MSINQRVLHGTESDGETRNAHQDFLEVCTITEQEVLTFLLMGKGFVHHVRFVAKEWQQDK